jgi:preprotein translocase subunit YajC
VIQFLTLLAGNPDAAQQPNTFGFFMPIILIFLIMYFLIFRPQMKKQKQQKLMLDAVKKGDKIITVGGIMGTVAGVKEKEGTLIVKISDNTKIELVRTSIAKVVGQEE